MIINVNVYGDESDDDDFDEDAGIITTDNWDAYAKSTHRSHNQFWGYLLATQHIIPELANILETAKTFEEMKAQLTELHEGRKALLEYGYHHLPS